MMKRTIQNNVRVLSAITVMCTFSISNAFAENFPVDAKINCVSEGGVGLDTGIDVMPGKLLVINANKMDKWSAYSYPNSNDKRSSNANGLGNPYDSDYGTWTKPGTDFSFLYGSLVGSLDNGLTFFSVGTHMEMSVINAGRLRLYYWDSTCKDNSGNVIATVEVYSGP